ncbi:hypothetical protein NAL19_879 [Pectobacterium sp. F1-1]|nr:hypothetical protein NAL19_879 [Pectobacterium sp. F1-1]
MDVFTATLRSIRYPRTLRPLSVVLVGFFSYALYNPSQDYPVFYGTFRRLQTPIPILLGWLMTEAVQS